MKQLFIRVTGLMLILTAIIGLVLCVAGVVGVSRIEGPVTVRALHAVDVIGRGLNVASDGLAVANTSLQKAGEMLAFIKTTVDGLAQVIGDNKPILTSLATVAGEDVPANIKATQSSLATAENTAKMVDDTLAALTSLPFISGSNYAPPVSLHTSLANISDGLGNLSTSFKEVQASLNTTADNLEQARTGMTRIADDISAVQRSMAEAQAVVGEYQGIVARAQAGLPAVRQNLPGWIHLARWAISLALVWLGMMQIGLLSQGLGMVGRGREQGEQQPVVRQRRVPAFGELAAAAQQTFRALTSRVAVLR